MAQSVQEKKNDSLHGFVSARDLSIIWGSDSRYWKWENVKKDILRCDSIQVAKLIKVWWLQIDGKYDGQKLEEGVYYEVSFVVELNNNLVMNGPVNLTLTLPDGTRIERTEDLNSAKKNEWIRLTVGGFTATPKCLSGDVKFSMMNIDASTWKTGLVVIGAVITTKV